MPRLGERHVRESDYIQFYALRSVGFKEDELLSEQIYVHSKLLHSESKVIIGSANINERRCERSQ